MDATLEAPAIRTLSPALNRSRRLDGLRALALSPAWLVVLYALAMAWVESAVVFYLRTMFDRIEPYQPHPLPIGNGFALAEIVREGATMVMLLAVGCLAGRTWRSRFGYALLAFGVWDIAYYVWLVPLTGWPQSLGDWDVLFLIPLPWWGPVWSPVSIAALMILFGSLVGRHDRPGRPIWPGRFSSAIACFGVLLALGVFMWDSILCIRAGGDAGRLRDMLPHSFHWMLFLVALGSMAVPVAEVALRGWGLQGIPADLDFERWLTHFRANRVERPEPDWTAPLPDLPPAIRVPFVHSLEQFRLGDGGGPAFLIAFDVPALLHDNPGTRLVVEGWFKEEAEHSRLLGCAVKRHGGRHLTSHWSFTAFCLCRRFLGVRFELQVLTLTELVSTGYYRVLQRHSPDPAVTDMCNLILRDEAGHVAFQRARLSGTRRSASRLATALWQAQFWVLGYAAATMLWVNHGPCLTAIGGSRGEYYREMRRELRRFMSAVRSERGHPGA